jgi:signal transduction histidine kinase
MFRRYPYWIWLMISILLWCLAGYRYYAHTHALLPQQMARTIGNDISQREEALDKLLKNKDLLNRMFADSLTGNDMNFLQKQPYYVFAYDNDTLSFWNSNIVLSDCKTVGKGPFTLLHHPGGIALQQCITLGSQHRLTILFPIVVQYSLENDYLKSHYAAADYIPISTQVLTDPAAGSFEVHTADGKILMYLQFHKQDIQHWVPDAVMIWLIIAAIVFSVSWLQLIIIRLVRLRSPLWGFLVTFLILAALRILIYITGFPLGLQNLKFFSPSLYASSMLLPSLGDMLLNALCVLWLVIFIVRHVHYRRADVHIYSKPLRIFLIILLAALMVGYSFGFLNVIRSLVLDSNMSFDLSHFYSINGFTIIGLFTISLITAVSCTIIYLLNIRLNLLLHNKWLKYLLLVVVGALFLIPCVRLHEDFYYFLVLWILLFVVLLDIKALSPVSDLLAPHMVFWAIFVCIFCTAVLYYFNHIKERETRKIFADQRVTPVPDDIITEYAFINTGIKIEGDKIIKSFLKKPSAAARKQVNEHIDLTYLVGQLNKYQEHIYVFDRYGHSLYNRDTLTYNDLAEQVNEATVTMANALYYKEYEKNSHNYIAYIPMSDDSTDERTGYIFIDLALKQAPTETVYPELLQPTGIKSNPTTAEYSYAIYENGKLVSHTNDYPFPDFLKADTLKQQRYVFYNRNSSSELWYRYNKNRTIIVVHNHNAVIETITLFSYIFGIEISIAVLLMLYQLCLAYFQESSFSRKFTKLTLRQRIHFSMLGVVLVSFTIIGIVTIAFFRNQYETTNITKLESAMQVVEESMQDYMKANKGLANGNTFDTTSRSKRFNAFITNLAADQKIDINLFNTGGSLEVTSQDDIYDKALLARIIRPDAYYQLNNLGRSLLIQNEKIGTLSYLSCYVPLHDEYGTRFGYINVPFFSSEKDLNFQISNIVVTLINLYAFIFLLSSLFTVFISRWLTRTLNIVISQFSRLNLQRNERIQWPYDDEIGLLVKEYNKMVKKVEENAALLAQSERESAWREMARQVAHEIKNPLTPMKLNIQYLQQALSGNHPNARELVERVSVSLVEQIDNLSYIASEFSNFAKMPEARPEEIDLNSLLDTALELYLNDKEVQVSLRKSTDLLNVYADRSQLLRVFNNLLQNAKQAIPSDREGIIQVSVEKKENNALISVKDNGEGIPEEMVHKIFQPYFTTKSSGTGLGLAMTRKIIEFWRGKIWFETEEGEGTTFFIELPLHEQSL